MTSVEERIDHEEAKRIAAERREKARWALDTTRMAKSGYAPRKYVLANWVIEACDLIDDLLTEHSAREEELQEVKRERDEAIKQRNYDYERFAEAKAAILEHAKRSLALPATEASPRART